MSRSEDVEGAEFFLRARKEAIVAGVIWAVFFVWVVGVSYLMGYGTTDPSLVMWVPAWVFWGILLPFVVATAVNCAFAFFYLKDEDEKL